MLNINVPTNRFNVTNRQFGQFRRVADQAQAPRHINLLAQEHTEQWYNLSLADVPGLINAGLPE